MPPDEKQLQRIAAFKEPHAFYVSGEDNLRITSLNSVTGVTVTITGRMITLDGRVQPFTARHVPNTDRTARSTVEMIGEGWIANLSAVVTAGAPQRAQTWIRVDVVRGSSGAVEPLATLMQGFVTATEKLAFPGSPIIGTLDGPGAIRSIVGTNPAAGAETVETVPTGARWKLLTWRTTLVTDATVANRVPVVHIDDGSVTLWNTAASAAQVASTSISHNLGLSATSANQQGLSMLSAPAAPPILRAGFRIRTQTSSIQAGDDWGAAVLYVEEWLEP